MVHIEKYSLPSITLRCLVTGNTFADLKLSFRTCILLKAIHLYDWTGPRGCRRLRLPEFLFSPMHRPPLPPGNILGTHRGWVNTRAIVWMKLLSRSNPCRASTNCDTPYPVHTARDAINDVMNVYVQSRTYYDYRQVIMYSS